MLESFNGMQSSLCALLSAASPCTAVGDLIAESVEGVVNKQVVVATTKHSVMRSVTDEVA
jgi:hypothetical protein